MDTTNRQYFDWWLFLCTLALFCFGMVMNFSASSVMAADSAAFGHNPFYFLVRQLIWGAVGFMVLFYFWRTDLEILRRRYSLLAVLAVMGLLWLVFTPLGLEDSGVRRALGWGPLSFLPGELAKLALVFYLADVFTRRKQDVQKPAKVIPTVIIFLFILAPIMLQPNLSTGIMVAACYFALLYLAGGRMSHLFLLGGLGVAGVAVSLMHHTYQLKRLSIFLNPWSDPQGDGYQIIQSRIALGSGGIFGLGLGNSREKFFYLPENHTDFIMSIVGEEIGLLGSMLVLILFLALLYRGLRIAKASTEPFHAMLAAGLTFLICFQALINLGVIMGLLPPTGVSMPFLSYGGSSLLVFMAAAGLLMNVSRLNYQQVASMFPLRSSRRISRSAVLAGALEADPEVRRGRRERPSIHPRPRVLRPRVAYPDQVAIMGMEADSAVPGLKD